MGLTLAFDVAVGDESLGSNSTSRRNSAERSQRCGSNDETSERIPKKGSTKPQRTVTGRTSILLAALFLLTSPSAAPVHCMRNDDALHPDVLHVI
jgi:hypothetical protein